MYKITIGISLHREELSNFQRLGPTIQRDRIQKVREEHRNVLL